MDLLEYESRQLFESGGVPVLKGWTVDSVAELDAVTSWNFPLVVKAQVATGGRGKAGGVRFASNIAELRTTVGEILGMRIKQFTVERVMIVEKAKTVREMYLAVLLDRNTKKYGILFSPCGGVEIEQTARTNPDQIFKMEIDPLLGYNMADGLYLGEKAGLSAPLRKELAERIAQLYALCRANDATLTEINPLVVTADGALLALDAKVSVDDSAVFRHPQLVAFKQSHAVEPLVKEAAEYRFLYIPCDATGNVVVMSNGSGMLMSCIDHITRNGNRVSAVLDLGGGSTADRIEHGIRILFQTPGAQVLFINIFGGITRCDEVARGIQNAIANHSIQHPMIVRVEGTNKEEGLAILRKLSGVILAEGLHDGEEAIRRYLP